jgi:hypothetical protein
MNTAFRDLLAHNALSDALRRLSVPVGLYAIGRRNPKGRLLAPSRPLSDSAHGR